MCSDPQTFISKTTGAEVVGACRICDECIAARRAGWVARAMAEKTQWQHALCVSLTYDDKAPGGYDAARFFAYHDVRAFIQRVTAALRRIDKALFVRFICAGEQGSRNGRCHWHLILYSDHDLRTLGTVSLGGQVLKDPESMMTVGKKKRRLHWSLWAVNKYPLGFVTFGDADQAGASYVVSYCLKDQFTSEKSMGKGREAKSEAFATGLFRQSKRPAIGEKWLWQKLQGLDEISAGLPNTNLKVPGLSWYWYPSGSMREKLLWGLLAINQRSIWAGRGEVPQWSGLLEACKDNPSDLEILNVAQKDDEREIGEAISFKARWRAGEISNTQAARRKGVRTFCYVCLINWDERERQAKGVGSHLDAEERWFRFYDAETGDYAISDPHQIRTVYGEACCEACGATRFLRIFPKQGQA